MSEYKKNPSERGSRTNQVDHIMTHEPVSSQESCEPKLSMMGAYVPVYVEDDPNICPGAKILYQKIFRLSHERGYCYASNAWLAEKLNLSTRAIQKQIEQLKKAGHIIVEIIRNGMRLSRRIYIAQERLHQKFIEHKKSKNQSRTDGKENITRTRNKLRLRDTNQCQLKNLTDTKQTASGQTKQNAYRTRESKQRKKSSSQSPSSLPDANPPNVGTDDDFFSCEKKKEAKKTDKAEEEVFTPEELEILSRAKEPVIHKRAYLNKAKQMHSKTTPSPKQAVLKLLNSLPSKHYSYRFEYGKVIISSTDPAARGYFAYKGDAGDFDSLKAWVEEKDHLAGILDGLGWKKT